MGIVIMATHTPLHVENTNKHVPSEILAPDSQGIQSGDAQESGFKSGEEGMSVDTFETNEGNNKKIAVVFGDEKARLYSALQAEVLKTKNYDPVVFEKLAIRFLFFENLHQVCFNDTTRAEAVVNAIQSPATQGDVLKCFQQPQRFVDRPDVHMLQDEAPFLNKFTGDDDAEAMIIELRNTYYSKYHKADDISAKVTDQIKYYERNVAWCEKNCKTAHGKYVDSEGKLKTVRDALTAFEACLNDSETKPYKAVPQGAKPEDYGPKQNSYTPAQVRVIGTACVNLQNALKVIKDQDATARLAVVNEVAHPLLSESERNTFHDQVGDLMNRLNVLSSDRARAFLTAHSLSKS